MRYPISPEYMQAAAEHLTPLYQNLEDYIIEKICEQFKTGEANATALELIRELQRRGLKLDEIERRIKQTLKISQQQLDNIFNDAIERNQAFYGEAFSKAGLVGAEEDLESMFQEALAIAQQTEQQFVNLTQSMGFAVCGIDGQIHFQPIAEAYQTVLDRATVRILSGTDSYDVVIRQAVRDLSDSGIQFVDYASGYRNRADVAVRRAVMTGVTQISAKHSDMAAEELETPYREVSAHRGARDTGIGWQNHKNWQGKVYSVETGDIYPSIYAVCGLDEVDGLCGVNCRHMYYPFWEGISERTYTDEELANIDPPPIKFDGKEYSYYEATQEQRRIERALRSIKRRMIGDKAAGQEDAYTADAIKYRRLNEEYDRFTKAAGLPSQKERSYIQEFGPKEAQEAIKAASASSERQARVEDSFEIGVPFKGDAMKPHSIYKELNKSEVGRRAIERIDQKGIRVEVNYSRDVDPGVRGERQGNLFIIYAHVTKTVRKTAETIIHEATHHELDTAKNSLWEECYCFAQEAKHTKSVLTFSDLRVIVKMVKELYPELKWRA